MDRARGRAGGALGLRNGGDRSVLLEQMLRLAKIPPTSRFDWHAQREPLLGACPGRQVMARGSSSSGHAGLAGPVGERIRCAGGQFLIGLSA
jgi:hypothetical protein